MSAILFLLVFIVCGIDARTTCNRGWLADEGACYLFGTTQVHFTEAGSYCRQHGAHLVEVSSAHENNFLKTHIRQLKDREWWIGLTDEEVETEWRWFYSDSVANFTSWGQGEPGPSTDNTHCVVLHHSLDYA